MGRRLSPLHSDALDDLPERCRRCVFWELGSPRPSPKPKPEGEGAAAADRVRKQAWVTSVGLETGPPGVVVHDGRTVVGHASFAPALSYGHLGAGIPPTSHDALLLATAWIEQDARGHGVGRQIVAAALRDAIRLDLRAVEAYGDRRDREWDCVLPAWWLLQQGFEIHNEHPRYPLFRLDVRRAARWAESLEHAMKLVRGRGLRQSPATVPAATSELLGS